MARIYIPFSQGANAEGKTNELWTIKYVRGTTPESIDLFQDSEQKLLCIALLGHYRQQILQMKWVQKKYHKFKPKNLSNNKKQCLWKTCKDF